MLDPDQRALLLDALRPPLGMVLDHAVATTFTLDLDALLIAPIAFALFDAEDGRLESVDPISLLEAVRRNADRMDVFCQAGLIGVPAAYQPVLTQLEDSVHPVIAPFPGGIFHPKVWVLRFTNPDGSGAHHRVLVLSRNLTFDRSWDLVVRLDEDPLLDGGLDELAALMRALPSMSIDPPSEERVTRIGALASAVKRVGFAAPPPFRQPIDLAVFGTGLAHRPEDMVAGAQRLLVMAPFIGNDALRRFTSNGARASLVSRTESLDQIPTDTLRRFEEVLVLDPLAAPEGERPGADTIGSLSGLHAKLLIAERGWDAQWWIGSANATNAAYGRNVEMMVALNGRKYGAGIDSFLGSEAEGGFRGLLRPYVRNDDHLPDPDQEVSGLGRVGLAIAAMRFRAIITADAGSDGFALELTSDDTPEQSDEISVQFWPITLPRDRALPVAPGAPISLDFGQVSLHAITPFFAFEVGGSSKGGPMTETFVVRATLVGDPEDRRQRILTAQLRNKRDVLRYLLLLLSDFDDDSGLFTGLTSQTGPASGNGDRGGQGLPVFESMMRTLATSPRALDHVARLIDDLRATEEGNALLPDGLDEVWDPIWQARQALR